MVVTLVAAQPRIVGVTVGDWFKYGDITFSWSSNDPNATIPYGFEELSETEWMKMTVTDVSGTNITFQIIFHFKNGTEKTYDNIVDIDTGEGNVTMWAISANLNANDTIYSSFGYSTMKINETIVRTYPDGVRDTNHLNNTAERSGAEFYEHLSMNNYWDRSCGIIVEMSQEQTSQIEGYTTIWSLLIRITESNFWVVPEFPTWTSILLLVIVLTVTIVISKRRPLKTPIR